MTRRLQTLARLSVGMKWRKLCRGANDGVSFHGGSPICARATQPAGCRHRLRSVAAVRNDPRSGGLSRP
jgi:hypothetical protein